MRSVLRRSVRGQAVNTPGWQAFDPFPDYPALWSFHAGKVLVACRSYMAGQRRVQIAIEYGYGFDITGPEF